jgi:two-component system, OmpR family, KDP operon response regulator KdpE
VSGARILVVDDDPAILRSIQRGLEGAGFDVSALGAAAEVIATIGRWRPDVVVLDLVLPDGDGAEICKEVRKTSTVPIIVLSAVDDDRRKVDALNNGADDYVVKPFSMPELQARVRGAIRRSAGSASTSLAVGPLRMDVLTRKVSAGGTAVHLTPTEYELLRLLLSHPGRVFTQRHLLSEVWGPEFQDDTHILRTFVHQLRTKLSAADPGAGGLIVNDPGVGYRIEAGG